jgi:hypothetical protein
VVEKDHITSPEKEYGGAQHDNTTPVMGDAPNFEEKDDPPTNSDKNVKEVILLFFLQFIIFSKPLNVLLKGFMIFLQDESKGETPKEQVKQPLSEPPIPSPTKENVDENTNSHGEGPSTTEGDGVEPKKPEEKKEKQDGPDPETRSLHTEDLPLGSSISQPKPSVSAKSN